MSSKSEGDIQLEILDYLNRNGIFAFRVNNIGVYDAEKDVYRKPSKFQIAGISDIIAITKNGRFLAIEVKTEVGKLSRAQSVFINKINRCGGLAFCARSVEEVILKLEGVKNES